MTAGFEVRWVYSRVRLKSGREHEIGQKPCLCLRGKKFAACLVVAHPVFLAKRPVEDYDRYRVLQANTDAAPIPYPPADAIRQLADIVGRNGATVGAKRFLDRALAWSEGTKTEVEIDVDNLTDEEELMMENSQPVSAPANATTGSGTETTKEKTVKTTTTKKPAARPSQAKRANLKGPTKTNGKPNVKPGSEGRTKGKIIPKAKAAAKPGAPRGAAPRPNTITELVVKLSKEKKDTKAIGNAVAKAFPKTSFAKEVADGDYHAVGYYQGTARKRGWLPKAK